jgi:ribonuclease HII
MTRCKGPDPTGLFEAGVDEAGRGPLAGPVVVAAVVLPPAHDLDSLDDSKRLSVRKRQHLAPLIKERAVAWAVEVVDVAEIDRYNILQATLLGMERAVGKLDPKPDRVLVDGNRAPRLPFDVQTIVGGDRLVQAISAASILAKVHRDGLMVSLHDRYPDYGFDRHKGYPTAVHLERLETLGACPAHRRSFAPVQKACR